LETHIELSFNLGFLSRPDLANLAEKIVCEEKMIKKLASELFNSLELRTPLFYFATTTVPVTFSPATFSWYM